MSEEIELKLLSENEELRRRLNKLEGKNSEGIPSYSFSKIREKELKLLFTIKKNFLDDTIFDNWFENSIKLDEGVELFLKTLIQKNIKLMSSYNEEDLKIHFLSPIFGSINFKSLEYNFRDFYEYNLTYKTEKFILNGTTDFILSTGLTTIEKPYFFIQEFKKSKEYSDPEPQLLAELISAVELNNWKTIKGAYIVGAIWNFVILEKLGKDSYQYFVSINFDSTKIEDLKTIYKNLLFVKNEIIEMAEMEKNKLNKNKGTKK